MKSFFHIHKKVRTVEDYWSQVDSIMESTPPNMSGNWVLGTPDDYSYEVRLYPFSYMSFLAGHADSNCTVCKTLFNLYSEFFYNIYVVYASIIHM